MAHTIREWTTSWVAGDTRCCIIFPAAAQGKTAKLRSSLLERIPTFNGLTTEDPNKHLKEFQLVCISMMPEDADENILMLKVFYFSLVGKATDWFFYHLPSGHITCWDAMKQAFLEKYYPTGRIMHLMKKICGIQQGEDESYPAYYERFKSLMAQCPQHLMNGELLLQHFYEGLRLSNTDHNVHNPPGFYQKPQAPPTHNSGTSTNYDEMIEALMNSTQSLILAQNNLS